MSSWRCGRMRGGPCRPRRRLRSRCDRRRCGRGGGQLGFGATRKSIKVSRFL